jgi:glutamate 5-kinase
MPNLSSIRETPRSPSRITWLRDVRRLVVKVGTSTLTGGTRTLDRASVARLTEQIVRVRERGVEVILITSGAIAAGMGRLDLTTRPRDIGSLQAVAAVGQSLLMHAYETSFRAYHQPVAQVLLTAGDLSDRRRYLNVSNALASLFRFGVVPIVNENDTVSVDEIRVGDNDTLAALVANAADADLLILLSDIDGVFTEDPHRNLNATLIPVIHELTSQVRSIGEEKTPKPNGEQLGTGRLATKLHAAEIMVSSGKPMVLANGARANVVSDILDGCEIGTFFVPAPAKIGRRKQWIGFMRTPRGAISVDTGARDAVVNRGKSLLPSGIVSVTGTFQFGDAVRCLDPDGVEFARGLVNYSAEEVAAIRGKRTDAIEGILGYRYSDEVIHRDNLVVIENGALRVRRNDPAEYNSGR